MTKNFLGVFALTFYIVPVVCALVIIPWRRRKMRGIAKLLTQQALKRDGTVKYMLGIPYYMEYDSDGVPITLSLSLATKKAAPEVKMSANVDFDPKITATISSIDPPADVKKSSFKTDNPDFNAAFNCDVKNETKWRELLNAELQSVLLRWKRKRLHVSIRPTQVVMRLNESISDQEKLSQFLDGGEKLISNLKAGV